MYKTIAFATVVQMELETVKTDWYPMAPPKNLSLIPRAECWIGKAEVWISQYAI